MRIHRRFIGVPLLIGVVLVMLASCGAGDAFGQGARGAGRPPVVMIVFDGFSTISLLDKKRQAGASPSPLAPGVRYPAPAGVRYPAPAGVRYPAPPDKNPSIDAVRYPAFARLAAEGTWFPYATTSLDETGRAMRSLLVGRTTWRFARPTYAEHPRNLFTLLGSRYRMAVSEEATSMCPGRLCRGARVHTPRLILRRLAGGRPKRLQTWLNTVGRRSRPTFFFKHILFPHWPWNYLPSGLRYVDPPTEERFSWRLHHSNGWLIKQSYQRHLLQVGQTDRLLGKVLDRLKATGLYDRALIVVTADHGESFGRRGNGHLITRASAADIALKPLFVKLPGQRRGVVDRRHVRTIDVLPTIAEVARVPVRWRVDGHSVFGPAARRIPSSTLLIKRDGRRLRLSPEALARRADASLALKLKLFGSGKDPPGLYGIGPYPSLHGTPVSRWQVLRMGRTRAAVDSARSFRAVRRASGVVPVRVTGHLRGRGSRARRDLAVAVNGTIVATGPAFRLRRGGTRFFSLMLPEAALHDGANRVRLFAIVQRPTGPQLRPLTR